MLLNLRVYLLRVRRRIVLSFMQTRFYEWLLKSIVPFIRYTTYYPKFPGYKYLIAYELIQKGDYILTIDIKKLTSYIIGGEWTHAALFIGKAAPVQVHEFTHKDFTQSTFFDVCKESDEIAIFRCNDPRCTPEFIDKVIDKSWSFQLLKYDSSFKLAVETELGFKIDALYCSEHIYEAYFRILDVSTEDLAGLGQEYISPVGLSRAKNVTCIFDSRKIK